MKKPSKIKLGFDLVFGGFMLASAAFLRPYDFENVIIGGLGLLWIAAAARALDEDF